MPNFWMKLPCPKPLVNGLGYILKTLDRSYLELAFGLILCNVDSWPKPWGQFCTYGATDPRFFRREPVSTSLSWYCTTIRKMSLYWRSVNVGWLQSEPMDLTFPWGPIVSLTYLCNPMPSQSMEGLLYVLNIRFEWMKFYLMWTIKRDVYLIRYTWKVNIFLLSMYKIWYFNSFCFH